MIYNLKSRKACCPDYKPPSILRENVFLSPCYSMSLVFFVKLTHFPAWGNSLGQTVLNQDERYSALTPWRELFSSSSIYLLHSLVEPVISSNIYVFHFLKEPLRSSSKFTSLTFSPEPCVQLVLLTTCMVVYYKIRVTVENIFYLTHFLGLSLWNSVVTFLPSIFSALIHSLLLLMPFLLFLSPFNCIFPWSLHYFHSSSCVSYNLSIELLSM